MHWAYSNRRILIIAFLSFAVINASTASSAEFRQLDGGPAAIWSGSVHSVIETTTQNYARLWFKRSNQWIGSIGASEAGLMTVGVGGDDNAAITIVPDGRIGIWTTAPTQKLSVNWSISIRALWSIVMGAQSLSGDNVSALYFTSNQATQSQLILRDSNLTVHGRLYGTLDGNQFGLIDADNNWSYQAVKDQYTAFIINNSEKMRVLWSGNVGIWTTAPTQKLTVAGTVKANEVWASKHCDSNGANCINSGGKPVVAQFAFSDYASSPWNVCAWPSVTDVTCETNFPVGWSYDSSIYFKVIPEQSTDPWDSCQLSGYVTPYDHGTAAYTARRGSRWFIFIHDNSNVSGAMVTCVRY